MTPRENLLHLLRKEPYEEVPVEFSLCPLQEQQFHEKEQTNESYQSYFRMPWQCLPGLIPDEDLKQKHMAYHRKAGLREEEVDLFGVGHRATPTSMHMTKMYCPLAEAETEEEIRNFPVPSFSAEKNPDLRKYTDEIRARGLAVMAGMQCTVWETAWYIRGMENLMMDMISEDPKAEILLDRITEMSVQRAELYARADPDILFLGDDVGMQRTLLMSRELYRQWLQPRLKRVIDAAKRIKPDLIIFYHSCGYVEPVIPDLIEAGIDVLNPIQPECMDFGEIYRKYSDQISFYGTIGTQSVLPFGTPEEVRDTVVRNLKLADRGGLLVTPTHLVEPEVPWENIRAYVDACRSYRVT